MMIIQGKYKHLNEIMLMVLLALSRLTMPVLREYCKLKGSVQAQAKVRARTVMAFDLIRKQHLGNTLYLS